jgi:ribosomal protein L11 methyltransferase
MDWIEISVQADGEAAEAVSALFNRLNSRPDGQGGAVTEVTGFDPVGEAHRPYVLVRTYLPADEEDTPERQRRLEEGLWFLGRLYPLGEPITRRLAEEDWANAWKAHYQPFRIGRRFLVIPSWLWPGPDASTLSGPAGTPSGGDPLAGLQPGPDDLRLILDPGMAFGTGLHPSTQLCLIAMEDAIERGQRVLDAGCGSGILSIAAACLGATSVQAFDIDTLAVKATAANAALNDLPIPIQVFAGTGPDGSDFWAPPAGAPPQFDVILVNILLPVILDLLDRDLARYLAPGGHLILAGVIAEQEPQLREALDPHGLVVARQLAQGDWVAFVVGARQTPR